MSYVCTGVRIDDVDDSERAADDSVGRLEPSALGVDVLGERATMVHFSTAFCAPCRQTRQTLARGDVFASDMSADGRILITWDRQERYRLWDVPHRPRLWWFVGLGALFTLVLAVAVRRRWRSLAPTTSVPTVTVQ